MTTVFHPEETIDIRGIPYLRPAYWEAILELGNGRVYVGYGDTKRCAVLNAINWMNFYEVR